MAVAGPGHPQVGTPVTRERAKRLDWRLGPSAATPDGVVQAMLHRIDVPEARQRIFQSEAAALEETKGRRVASTAAELLRFITTPRATQAMVRGAGVNLGRFKPAVHVTLWS